MIEFDVSNLPAEVVRELVRGENAKEVFLAHEAQKSQQRIAAQTGEHRTTDGLGQMMMNIDPFAWHKWAGHFGTYDCWKDKAFRREFARDNPEVRVKTLAGGATHRVGWRGLVAPGHTSSPRFRKSYL